MKIIKVKNLDEVKLNFDKFSFCDTETIGLYGTVRLIQLTQDGENVYIFDTNEVNYLLVKDLLKQLKLVFWNASYDLACLDIIPKQVDDLMWMTKLINPYLPAYSLDVVAMEYGIDLYKGFDKKELQKSDFSKALTDKQIQYAATDVIVLYKLWHELDIENVKLPLIYDLDIKSLKYAIEYQRNGLSVDNKQVLEELRKINKEINENEVKLKGLNVNSPMQCKKALGTDSTDKSSLLHLISKGNELAKLVYDQRRLLKRKTLLESYNYPKVYTKFNVAGAATGRFTATGKNVLQGINSQQIPRALKKMFYDTNYHRSTIEADYSTLELRLAAAIFKDKFMYKQLMDGEDLHTSMAQFINGRKDITDEERTRAKAINFGLVFGMSAKAFVEYAFMNFGINYTLAEATAIRDKYFERYKDIGQYHKYVWNNYKKADYVFTTALGRRVRPNLGTDAINGPIQGTGAEVTKLAIHYMVRENPEVLKHISNVVHDSIKLEVLTDEEDYYKDLLEKSMLKAWTEISKCFYYKDIPMKVDIKVVRS